MLHDRHCWRWGFCGGHVCDQQQLALAIASRRGILATPLVSGERGIWRAFVAPAFVPTVCRLPHEIKKRVELPYPNSSGVLSTAGGIVVTALLDGGSIITFDDERLDVLWRINVGSGVNASPMTYSVSGKQYVAIASGPCCVRPSGQIANSKSRIAGTPELRDMSHATVLYVFGL